MKQFFTDSYREGNNGKGCGNNEKGRGNNEKGCGNNGKGCGNNKKGCGNSGKGCGNSGKGYGNNGKGMLTVADAWAVISTCGRNQEQIKGPYHVWVLVWVRDVDVC